MKAAERADPAAEEAAQQQGRDEDDERPREPDVEGVAGERGADRDERVRLEKDAYGLVEVDRSGHLADRRVLEGCAELGANE
jgi:hypothetical protein